MRETIRYKWGWAVAGVDPAKGEDRTVVSVWRDGDVIETYSLATETA